MKRCVHGCEVEKGSMGMRILIIVVMFALALTIVFRDRIAEYVYDRLGYDVCDGRLEGLMDAGDSGD